MSKGGGPLTQETWDHVKRIEATREARLQMQASRPAGLATGLASVAAS